MIDIDDSIFEDMLSDINSMSQEELIQSLKDAPDSGIGYALFGVHGEGCPQQTNNEESVNDQQ